MIFRHQILPLLAGLFLLSVPLSANAVGPDTHTPLEQACFPSLESAIRVKGPIFFCNEPVPLALPTIRERLEKELLLMLWDRAQVILWLKRTGRYFPYIEDALAKAGLPDDLKYVAVIESALMPHAGSVRGANGVWQFIESTGRNHGLTINRYVDERRNYRLATTAALSYFKDLYAQFESWTLACAGYNMGEMGLARCIKAQEVSNYYHLDLPTETERYVLRAIAAKIILTAPGKYGFRLRPGDYYRPAPCDSIVLKTGRAAPILVVAKAANTYYKTVRDLNPQFRFDEIPAGEHTLFLPKGSSKGFAARYKKFIAKYQDEHGTRTYTVRNGDTLTGIADRTGTSFHTLLKLNNLHRRSVIHPGQRLAIPH
ncbi:transglycosylase SLT domain-containing protein [Pseudodesulfovibrio sp.]|uniref:lytic transglycosylase domain-containing protein n=1 Tax=unclassified Pseudodesulfovibrio TaxID=2661612 RepID=UPI003AFFC69E